MMVKESDKYETIEKRLHEEISEQISYCEYDNVLTILKCFQILKKMKADEVINE